MLMGISDTTWEDILKTIVLTKGEVGLIVGVAIISFILGSVVVWLYFTKVRCFFIENQNKELTSDKEKLQMELQNANTSISQLEKEKQELEDKYKKFNDTQHVINAKRKDETDEALVIFTKK